MRVYFDISKWRPMMGFEGEEFLFCLAQLPIHEQQSVTRFLREEDKKRALLSRLLQRHCTSTVLGVPWGDIVIKRTKGQKPFVASHDTKYCNFNFNVSHEGT